MRVIVVVGTEAMSDHEIRIALVLNGGVSLAVWMGGVTHELDLIRRASGGAGKPAAQSVFCLVSIEIYAGIPPHLQAVAVVSLPIKSSRITLDKNNFTLEKKNEDNQNRILSNCTGWTFLTNICHN